MTGQAERPCRRFGGQHFRAAGFFIGGDPVGPSGMQHVKAILATLECKGHILVLVDCPLCDEPRRMEIDPSERLQPRLR